MGADSPSRDLRGRTSGVLLVLLLEEPEMEAWTEATARACSGGTYLEENNTECGCLCVSEQEQGLGPAVLLGWRRSSWLCAHALSPSLLLILVLEELLDFLRLSEVRDRRGSVVVEAQPDVLTHLQTDGKKEGRTDRQTGVKLGAEQRGSLTGVDLHGVAAAQVTGDGGAAAENKGAKDKRPLEDVCLRCHTRQLLIGSAKWSRKSRLLDTLRSDTD